MIYVIEIEGSAKRLIEAKSRKAAISFALPILLTAEKATAADVAQLMALGTKVEQIDTSK